MQLVASILSAFLFAAPGAGDGHQASSCNTTQSSLAAGQTSTAGHASAASHVACEAGAAKLPARSTTQVDAKTSLLGYAASTQAPAGQTWMSVAEGGEPQVDGIYAQGEPRTKDKLKDTAKEKAHGWLGVSLVAADGGVAIATVAADSPAERAGVKAGDVIASVDGQAVDGVDDVVALIRERKPGKDVAIGLWRELEVAVEAAPTPNDDGSPRPRLGVELDEDDGRVVIARVLEDSAASRGGLRDGDRVIRIDGDELATIDGLIERVRGTGIGSTVKIAVVRPIKVRLGAANAVATARGAPSPAPRAMVPRRAQPPTRAEPRHATPHADASSADEVREALGALREELQALRRELGDLRRELRELRETR